MPQYTNIKPATVSVENTGGIDTCEIEFDTGVTVLTGENATNRTSLLTAISGALGGSAATLKSDTDEGFVQLKLNDTTYTRHYYRQSNNTVVTEGEPYTEDSEHVDLFACLLEGNPARRVVEQGGDLRDILMEPVDTVSIQEQIRKAERKRDRITAELEEIEQKRSRLPELEAQRTSLEEELETVSNDLDTIRTELADHDLDTDAAEAAEALLSDLESRRQALTQTREEIETQQSTIDALNEEYKEVSEKLERINNPDKDRATLNKKLDKLQDRERELQDSITDLSAIVDFNEDLLYSSDVFDDQDRANENVTDKLDPMSATVKCWTRGSRVKGREIDNQLDELRTIIEEKRTKRQEIQNDIAELREELNQIQSIENQRREFKDRLNEIDRQIERREQRISDLEKKATDVREEIQKLEEEVKETEELRENELVEKYERLSELEYERGQLENELNDVQDEIQNLESLTDKQESLEAQQTQLREELESLRTRITSLENEVVDAFNNHMEEVLSLLSYKNIERIWIERKTRENNPEGRFKLHVVRSAADGTIYEDTIDHLSESEREVIGLVVALAGYLVHDVHELVPIMLLDSLEAIDANRIARLIDYMSEYTTYLIVALLEEDAQNLDESYTQLSVDSINL